jgi:tryptophan synthase alpha chain
MNRFRTMFAESGRRALVPFLMLGDPDPSGSLRIVDAAIAAGADALELGIPFSDPLADGPTIQRSAGRALAAGAGVDVCLDLVARIRERTEIPIGMLVYYNLIHRRGVADFCERVAAAGADAVLAADLPLEESGDLEEALEANDLGSVQLVAPNTPPERAVRLARRSTAFTYVVSSFGTTGARGRLPVTLGERLRALRAACDSPLVVGFGISRPEQVRSLHRDGADGVIVGSALIRLVERNPNDISRAAREVAELLRELRGKEAASSC